MISDSLDQRLPFYQRLGIRFHLLMCKLCRRYEKQLFFIKQILRETKPAQQAHSDFSTLSVSGRKRIKKEIMNQTGQKNS